MTRQEIDIILIRKAKQGNQRAYTCLFKYYYPQVHSYINAVVKNYTESEDLSMVALEKVFRKIELYYPFFTFKSWVFRISRNISIDHLKQKRFKYTEISCILADYETPETKYIDKESESRLISRIEKLPPNYKDVIYLHIDRIPVREVSSKLNISPINARTLLFRAKRKLLAS